MNHYQKIIQHVSNFLLAQNAKSEVPSQEYCAYRGSNGMMCAIGCLIPDSLYNERMESVAIISNPKLFTDVIDNIMIEYGVPSEREPRLIKLLRELQRIHDSCKVEMWKEEFDSLYLQYSLFK